MITLTKAIPVNEPGMPQLTRSDVFAGLRMKANNALPFVPAITECRVVEQRSPDEFVRDIVLRGQQMRELVTLQPETRVTFERLSGPVLGTIYNDIEMTADGSLLLRFSFNLTLSDVEPGGAEERAHAGTMEADYMKAVDATLAAIRKVALANA